MLDVLAHLQTPLDPLHGDGYQFWSGISTQPLDLLTKLGILAALIHRHNCHHARCWRVVRHGKTHCKRHEGNPDVTTLP